MSLFTLNIKHYERAIVMKNGNFSAYLKPGKHLKKLGKSYEYIVLDTRKPFDVNGYDIKTFMSINALKDDICFVDVKNDQTVVVFKNDLAEGYRLTGYHAFWKIDNDYSFITLNHKLPQIQDEQVIKAFNSGVLKEVMYCFDVASFESALMFCNQKYQAMLTPNRYYFLKTADQITIRKIDMRVQALTITGQDMMTSDKVPLRLNFICQYQIENAEISVLKYDDYEAALYAQMQMIIREYIGDVTLDHLLDDKKEMADYVMSRLKAIEDAYGATFIYAGLKDIILPGEIRDIINTVLVAEKQAKASVIARREETASTRSLLNTAKLMDENQTLYKLKELEYLEKIFDKVGHLTLNGGTDLVEQISAFVQKNKK